MRIGIDYRPVTAAPCSGIARQVQALECALLGRSGTEVVRFTAAPLDHPHRESACCPAWASPAHGLHRPQERARFELRFLPGALRQVRPDIYIATANSGLPPWRVPPGIRLVQLLHDVFQLTLENRHAHRLKALAYRWIDRLAIGRSLAVADGIWCPSHYTLWEATRFFPRHAARMHVLPNAVPAVGGGPPSRVPGIPEQGYWLVVGTREPRKNVPWFLRQWLAARERHPGRIPELVLVGDAADVPEELRGLDGTHFAGGLSDAQMLHLYAHAARLWQPSLAEGFGLPVVEAMAQGTPVAVARGSALDEVAPADAARFDPGDSEFLQDLMRTLSGPERLPSEEPDALRRWASRYDLPAYSERLWRLLEPWMSGGSA